MMPMQPTSRAAAQSGNMEYTDSPGGPEETVYGHDYAGATGNESFNAEGVVEDTADATRAKTSSETSASTSAGANELTPIREGEPLPTATQPQLTATQRQPESGTADVRARPRLDHSFSSPTTSDTANIRVVGEDEFDLVRRTANRQFTSSQGNNDAPTKPGHHQTDPDSTDPQQRLSAARRQLVQEAQHGDGLLATQGSAIDNNDLEDEDQESLAPGLGGVTSNPASKHIKTSSMPFLPSQGFDVLVSAPSHKGANQLNSENMERKRARADSNNRSAMDQTRHPGLSGARPTPKGRAAGGPAAAVGIRKSSTQSDRRASNATYEERGASAGYFDDDVPPHELTHLDRQGSTRLRRGSQLSHRTADEAHADHIEARPVGGRTNSHRSSKGQGQDTRSAWLSRNMPSHTSHNKDEGSGEGDGKRASLQQSREQQARRSTGGRQEETRQSEDTVFSSSLAAQDGRTNEYLTPEEKGYVDEDDEMWLGGQGTLADGSIAFPTLWSRWRYHGREFLAELLATTLLITVGTAVDCQVELSKSIGSGAGSYGSQNWAWGIAVASTIYLSGGRSGAHCNSAITLALATFRGFPWVQVPIYMTAQLLGSILGAAITYGIYLPAINTYEGGSGIRTLSGDHGTGKLFVTVPQLVFTPGSGFGTEVVATSILMGMVLAVGDETNAPPSDGLSALVLGLVVTMIGMSFGWPTSYAISPSRDLGPRLFLYMVGYGKELWTHNSYWWIYGPQVGCFTGALLGALLYDLAIFTGEESPINYTKQGWKQSTPARVGSRLMNSAERLEFWTSPLRKVRRGKSADSDSDEGTGRAGHTELDRTRSKSASIGAKGTEDGEVRDLRTLSRFGIGSRQDPVEGANDGPKRRQSQASQQLGAQEEGRLE